MQNNIEQRIKRVIQKNNFVLTYKRNLKEALYFYQDYAVCGTNLETFIARVGNKNADKFIKLNPGAISALKINNIHLPEWISIKPCGINNDKDMAYYLFNAIIFLDTAFSKEQ